MASLGGNELREKVVYFQSDISLNEVANIP